MSLFGNRKLAWLKTLKNSPRNCKLFDSLIWIFLNAEPLLIAKLLHPFLSFVAEFPRGPTQRIQKNRLPESLATSWDLEKSGHRLKRVPTSS